jgi:hypothetical protein
MEESRLKNEEVQRKSMKDSIQKHGDRGIQIHAPASRSFGGETLIFCKHRCIPLRALT